MEKPFPPAPTVLALMICETVLEDSRTRNRSLINTFSHIHALKFPCRHQKMAIYACMTDGRGEVSLGIRILHDNTRKVVIETKARARFKDPLSVLEMNFDLRGMIFPEPGRYSVELFSEHVILATRGLQLAKVEQQPKPPAKD